MRPVAVIGAGMIPFGKRIDDSLMDMLARVIEVRASKNIVTNKNFSMVASTISLTLKARF
ncbi:MAG: hypothetical protein HS124_13630 [Anaerolineales bacterium]|nr:hypothetical protein [Anaerolineales bacterium]MCL4259287.1 hypothetical protein [Anaerolineales bacterium]